MAEAVEIDNQVRALLREGEEVIWFTRPGIRAACWRRLPLLLMGVFWISIATAALRFAGPDLGLDVVFAIMLMCGALMASAPWLAAWCFRGAYYLVTSERVLIASSRFQPPTNSYPLEQAREARPSRDLYGFENLVFEVTSSGGPTRRRPRKIGFMGIDDAAEAQRQIERAWLALGKHDEG
ncbi:hypothetical protein MalM25_22970 [Planctomycetes bacterium MalM25]|nr:hypothetical protein MalM25_22970 [Planctomycetes bacterium MalM25]